MREAARGPWGGWAELSPKDETGSSPLTAEHAKAGSDEPLFNDAYFAYGKLGKRHWLLCYRSVAPIYHLFLKREFRMMRCGK